MNGRIHFTAGCLFLVCTLLATESIVAQTNNQSRPANRAVAGPERRPSANANPDPKMAMANEPQRGNMPPGFPISDEKQKRVDQILGFWEMNTTNVKTFRAEYRRIEFDPVMGPQGKPNMYAFGIVKYATPDKGLMRDERLYVFNAAPKPGEKDYIQSDQPIGEDWVCDGKAIFLKEPKQELLIERLLPPELQGKAISEGPLPFIFGAKATTMKRRFWIREVTPKSNPNGDYYLEATPKTREDAANYERIVVILDKEKDFLLPKKMEVTVRTFAARTQPGQPAPKVQKRVDIYEFTERKVNDSSDRVSEFFAQFVKPKVPAGWKKEVRKWDMQPADAVARQPDPDGQANLAPRNPGTDRNGVSGSRTPARTATGRTVPRLRTNPR
jgi:TIGR03009 family protein